MARTKIQSDAAMTRMPPRPALLRAAAPLALAMLLPGCDRNPRTSNTETVRIPIGSGDEFVYDKIFTRHGFEGSLSFRFHVKWRTGVTEELPYLGLFPGVEHRLVETKDRVFILCGSHFFTRPGSISKPAGKWQSCSITGSETLFRFMREYARTSNDAGVKITTRPSGQTTAEEMTYCTMALYVISPKRHLRCFLPYKIDHLDAETLDVVFASPQHVDPLPLWLVFSYSDQAPEGWQFDWRKTAQRTVTHPESQRRPTTQAGLPRRPWARPDPVVITFKNRLMEELQGLTPAPSYDIPEGQAGAHIRVTFRTRDYLVQIGGQGPAEEMSIIREGPADDGFILSLTVPRTPGFSSGEETQVVRGPHWSTYRKVYLLNAVHKEMYLFLSFGERTDQQLIQRIKQIADDVSRGDYRWSQLH